MRTRSMRLFKNYLSLNIKAPIDPEQGISPAQINGIYDALTRTAQRLEGIEWMLCGGVGLALTLGGFYRQHEDLDVNLNSGDLRRVGKRFEDLGYALCSRVASIKISRDTRLYVYREVRPVDLGDFVPHRLKFIKKDGNKLADPQEVDDSIDVWPYNVSQGRAFDSSGLFECQQEELSNKRVILPNGVSITLQNLDLIQKCKGKKDYPKNKRDLRAITPVALLEAA